LSNAETPRGREAVSFPGYIGARSIIALQCDER